MKHTFLSLLFEKSYNYGNSDSLTLQCFIRYNILVMVPYCFWVQNEPHRGPPGSWVIGELQGGVHPHPKIEYLWVTLLGAERYLVRSPKLSSLEHH